MTSGTDYRYPSIATPSGTGTIPYTDKSPAELYLLGQRPPAQVETTGQSAALCQQGIVAIPPDASVRVH